MVRAILFLTVLATLQSATLPLPRSMAAVQDLDGAQEHSELVARIDGLMREKVAEAGAVGLTLGISMADGFVYSAGYGKAELEHDVDANAETLFRIGSITKQFTAAAICRLSDQGRLYFDDPLTDFIPDYDTKGREITLRHLLTHTSGIFNYTNLGPLWMEVMARDLEHEELLAMVADRPLDFEPGTRYSYSNTGYYLLGMVVESVSGMSYAAFLEQEFFVPLGLSHTRYGSNTDLILNRAQGYQSHGEGRFSNDALLSMSLPYAAGSLLSSGADLVRWSLALAGGKVLKQESFEEMTLPYVLEDGYENPYGFGLALAPFGDRACLSHSGGINGFNSMMYNFPESKMCVAVVSNSEAYSAEEVAKQVIELLGE